MKTMQQRINLDNKKIERRLTRSYMSISILARLLAIEERERKCILINMISQTQQSKSKPLVLSGYALFLWSISYMILHLNWALGGKWLETLMKPGILRMPQIEFINWVASAILTAAGFVGLAFVYWNKGGFSKYVLLIIAWAGCSVAASHGIYGIVYRILQISGAIGLNSGPFRLDEDKYMLTDLAFFEPWFLIEGILLSIVGWCYLKKKAQQKNLVGGLPTWRCCGIGYRDCRGAICIKKFQVKFRNRHRKY